MKFIAGQAFQVVRPLLQELERILKADLQQQTTTTLNAALEFYYI